MSVFDDICKFSERSGIHFSYVMLSTSSAGTQAGLVVGQGIAQYETRVIGISASRTSMEQSGLVRELAESTAGLSGKPVDASSVLVDDGFVGPGYACTSKDGEAASQIFAKEEGIRSDPCILARQPPHYLTTLSTTALEGLLCCSFTLVETLACTTKAGMISSSDGAA